MADWPPAPRLPSRDDVNAWLAAEQVFSVPEVADESAASLTALARMLGCVRAQPSWSGEHNLTPGESACKRLWYHHSGYGPRSPAGGVRHAIAELFPNAASARQWDERSPEHDSMVEFLQAHFSKAQRHLGVIGVRTVTLYRGVHASYDDKTNPVVQRVCAALRDGKLHATGDGTLDVRGTVTAPPLVSAVDGWAVARKAARYWADSTTPGLKCVMVAEVQAWGVLSWGSLGLGDWNSFDEVLVLGGSGQVRWEVEGNVLEELVG